MYEEVFAFYELAALVHEGGGLQPGGQVQGGDVRTLIWQMCDPRNKTKTYYMPPTRDLSEPKARCC